MARLRRAEAKSPVEALRAQLRSGGCRPPESDRTGARIHSVAVVDWFTGRSAQHDACNQDSSIAVSASTAGSEPDRPVSGASALGRGQIGCRGSLKIRDPRTREGSHSAQPCGLRLRDRSAPMYAPSYLSHPTLNHALRPALPCPHLVLLLPLFRWFLYPLLL